MSVRDPNNIQVHKFDDTGDAYDYSQCSDRIQMGDVLVILSEQVVGFLLSAWPVAVTVEHGKLHAFTPGTPPNVGPCPQDARDWTPYYERARQVAREYGFPLSHE